MIIDVILVAILIFSALYGYHKGGVKVLSKVVSFILAIVLAYMFASTVGEWISNTNMGNSIKISIDKTINNYLQQNNGTVEDNLDEENSDQVHTDFNANTSPNDIIENVTQGVIDSNKDKIVNKITSYIFTGIGFVTIFISIRLILWILTTILNNVFELPILNIFNKFGGLIISLLITFVELSIVLAFINFASTLNIMNSVLETINSSVITKLIYEHNIVTYVILNKVMR